MHSAHDDPSQHDRRPTCEAKIATAPGPYGEVALRCGQSVGLVHWTDATGLRRTSCRVHEAGMRSLWPEMAGVGR